MGKKRTPLLNGDRHELRLYVREMADLMGLRDWTIVPMSGDPENPEHGACAQVMYGRKLLNLWFRKDWKWHEPESLRQTVVHELLHAHLNPLAHGTLNNVAELVGKKPYLVAWQSMTEQLELAVDAIAVAWAETLPLPVKE